MIFYILHITKFKCLIYLNRVIYFFESACPSNKYGVNCSSTCECRGRATRCDNVNGCICQDNWTGTNCDVDADECLNTDSCRPDQLCVNIDGSFKCTCPNGYSDVNGKCTSESI